MPSADAVTLENLYRERPFRRRNAEDFDLANVLDHFVNPRDGLATPFDFENTIVKGAMGTGKTMYLRANHALYLYSLVPAILEDESPIFPIILKMSDFAHTKDPSKIYERMMLKMAREMLGVHDLLHDIDRLVRIHRGVSMLPRHARAAGCPPDVIDAMTKMSSVEYTETLRKELGVEGKVKHSFLELAAKYSTGKSLELKGRRSADISEITAIYEALLADRGGQILLLIDEAGSLDRGFFRGNEAGETPMFEVLMNQLRTSAFVKTKIAVYPHTYSDVLAETRYGDHVFLDADVWNYEGYERFRSKIGEVGDRYIGAETDRSLGFPDVFEISQSPFGDGLEQLVNAGHGNMRRTINLIDQSMAAGFERHNGKGLVTRDDVFSALSRASEVQERTYRDRQRDFLAAIGEACRRRRTYRFTFPYKAQVLNRFIAKSGEHSLIIVADPGGGRRKNVYAFDYAYAVRHDLPTHYVRNTERIDKDRSHENGEWIRRVAQISDNIIEHADLQEKIEGRITWLEKDGPREKHMGFIEGDNGIRYFFMRRFLISDDRGKSLRQSQRVRFLPGEDEDGPTFASEIELL